MRLHGAVTEPGQVKREMPGTRVVQTGPTRERAMSAGGRGRYGHKRGIQAAPRAAAGLAAARKLVGPCVIEPRGQGRQDEKLEDAEQAIASQQKVTGGPLHSSPTPARSPAPETKP